MKIDNKNDARLSVTELKKLARFAGIKGLQGKCRRDGDGIEYFQRDPAESMLRVTGRFDPLRYVRDLERVWDAMEGDKRFKCVVEAATGYCGPNKFTAEIQKFGVGISQATGPTRAAAICALALKVIETKKVRKR
jgi:hypothetical protein